MGPLLDSHAPLPVAGNRLLPHPLLALLRINSPQALDDLEGTVACPGDVHVHADVMLAGHHFRPAARPFGDPRVVERLDDGILLRGARLLHGSLPQPQSPVQARARTATGELRAARIESVVPIEQFFTEGIADRLVVVEATVQTLHVCGRQEAQDVLLEVRADEVSAPLGEAGVVELREEWREA